MTPDQLDKFAGKEDRDKQKAAREKSYFNDEKEIRNRKSELTNKKYNMGGLSQEEEQELKYIKAQLKPIEQGRRNRFSKNL